MRLKHSFIQPRIYNISINLQLSVIILFLCAIAAPSTIAQSEIHYSDQWADDSVEDELQAVGVGITEADYDTEAESYTIQTDLKSPAGETVSVTSDGYMYTRAEVSVPWNYRLGTWLTSSYHWGIYQQCTYVHIFGGYTCRNTRILRETTNDYADYADNNTDVALLYRKDGPRLRDDYCTYAICVWMENAECAYGRKAPTRPYPGTDPNSCPAGYKRDFKVIVFRGYRLICWQQSQGFLNYNPC